MKPKNRFHYSIPGHELELLWRFSLRLTKDNADARWLLSQGCQRFIERRNTYFCQRRSRCELLGIVYRLWADEFRKPSLCVSTDNHTATADAPSVNTHSYGSQLASHIQQLPEAQRLVVLLVCVEEFSYTEAAEILGLSLASVKSRVVRARVAIGKHYLGRFSERPVYNRVW
ncbi:MAG: RNA polymerase sigma factor [Pseudomonadota bacterium]